MLIKMRRPYKLMIERRASRGEVLKAAFLGLLGTLLDGYDLVIGTTAASLVFTRIFFPPSVDPTLALVFSLFVVTLVTFVFRPVGAFIFGHIGDKLGRKVGLVWDLVLTGLGSLIIGLAPDYASAGYLGLALVILGRILVGIGLGGEMGGALTLAIEQAYAAGSRWRAFWAMVPYSVWGIVVTIASSILALLSAIYPGQSFYTIGWRITFYIGAIASLIGIIARWTLLESFLFEEAKRSVGTSRAPAVEVWRYWKAILGSAFTYALSNSAYYIFSSYAIAYATGIGISRDIILYATSIGGILETIFYIIFAIISDIWGRKKIIVATIISTIPLSFLYPLLILTKEFPMIILAQILLALVPSGIQGGLQALIAEHFPTRYRYSGAGYAMAFGGIFGGGIAPSVIALIIGTAYAERWWGISLILLIYVLLSGLSVTVLLRETIKEKMEH